MLHFLSVGMQASVVCYWSEIIHWVKLSSIHNDHTDVTRGTEGGFKTLKKEKKIQAKSMQTSKYLDYFCMISFASAIILISLIR